jgi:probable HAF family extracellular repeat protein
MGVRTIAALVLSASLAAGCSGGVGSSSVPETSNRSGVSGETGMWHAVRIVDIGSLPGYDLESDAFGANNNGVVVGRVCCSSPHETAVIYREGQLKSLCGLPGYSGSAANAVNDYGIAVGVSCFPGKNVIMTNCRATEFDSSGAHDLGLLQGTGSAVANAINSKGEVVGWASVSEGKAEAVVFRSGTARGLGGGVATAINDSGTIVGYTESNTTAVFYTHTGTISMGTLGGPYSQASAINDNGAVVGLSALNELHNGSYVEHPFLYDHNRMVDLGLPKGGFFGGAASINRWGDVVGQYSSSGTDDHAFLYTNGVMRDLNSLLPINSGWVLSRADHISDNGVIVGTGIHNGQTRGFILYR